MRQIKCLWCDSSCSFLSHCLFLKKRRKRNETPTHNGSTAIKSNELEQMEQKLNNDFFAHSRKTIHLRFTESSSDSKIKAKKRGNYLGNSIYSFQFVTYKCVRAFRLTIYFSSILAFISFFLFALVF